MDFLILEVDGSLSNPYAAGAVALWTVILSVAAVLLSRSASRSGRAVAKTTIFVALLLLTPGVQGLLGNVLYWMSDPGITSVGFWGGPPIWIAPTVSSVVALSAWTYFRKSHGSLSTGPET